MENLSKHWRYFKLVKHFVQDESTKAQLLTEAGFYQDEDGDWYHAAEEPYMLITTEGWWRH